jgi:hypothetical protein
VGPRYNVAKTWHLLSLDAPTIAALWSWFFVRAMHLHIRTLPILLLSAATWLLYVFDRLLDGLHPGEAEMRERHLFHARHRGAFVGTALLLALPLAWIIWTRWYAPALRDDLELSVFVVLYFFCVHAESRLGRLGKTGGIPKELAVGILFAAATAIPAWSRMTAFPNGAKARLAQADLLFAVLCWMNCVAIERWEGRVSPPRRPHVSTLWAGAHLKPILLAVALCAVFGAWLMRSSNLGGVYFAAFLSCGLLFALDARRRSLSPLSLRIAADAALLTPLAVFLIR